MMHIPTNNKEQLIMNNLQKRDLSQAEAFNVYNKIEEAYEAGDFAEAIALNAHYERLVANAIHWEQEELKA